MWFNLCGMQPWCIAPIPVTTAHQHLHSQAWPPLTPRRVQVKKVPECGSPQDSCVVRGLVARKNLVHRRMRRSIQQPRILMLASALEFQRNPHRLASFDHYSKDQVGFSFLADSCVHVMAIAVTWTELVLPCPQTSSRLAMPGDRVLGTWSRQMSLRALLTKCRTFAVAQHLPALSKALH